MSSIINIIISQTAPGTSSSVKNFSTFFWLSSSPMLTSKFLLLDHYIYCIRRICPNQPSYLCCLKPIQPPKLYYIQSLLPSKSSFQWSLILTSISKSTPKTRFWMSILAQIRFCMSSIFMFFKFTSILLRRPSSHCLEESWNCYCSIMNFCFIESRFFMFFDLKIPWPYVLILMLSALLGTIIISVLSMLIFIPYSYDVLPHTFITRDHH